MSTQNFPYDQFTTDAERDEFNNWIDETTEPITDDELEDIVRQEGACQCSLYRAAKAKFDTLHPFSRPDSLTRRGTMLIARRSLTVYNATAGAEDTIDDWRDTITRLFDKGVIIYSIDIDNQFNLRVRFTLHSLYHKELVKLNDGSLCTGFLVPIYRGDPSDVEWLSWCADRNGGGY